MLVAAQAAEGRDGDDHDRRAILPRTRKTWRLPWSKVGWRAGLDYNLAWLAATLPARTRGRDCRQRQINVGKDKMGERAHVRAPIHMQAFRCALFQRRKHKSDPAFARITVHHGRRPAKCVPRVVKQYGPVRNPVRQRIPGPFGNLAKPPRGAATYLGKLLLFIQFREGQEALGGSVSLEVPPIRSPAETQNCRLT